MNGPSTRPHIHIDGLKAKFSQYILPSLPNSYKHFSYI